MWPDCRLTSDGNISSLVSRGTDASHKGGVRRSSDGLGLKWRTANTHKRRAISGRFSTQMYWWITSCSSSEITIN